MARQSKARLFPLRVTALDCQSSSRLWGLNSVWLLQVVNVTPGSHRMIPLYRMINSVESAQVVNVTPRYAKLRGRADSREVIGWENIELISDRPLQTMLDEFKRLKDEFPDRILIASIMEVCKLF